MSTGSERSNDLSILRKLVIHLPGHYEADPQTTFFSSAILFGVVGPERVYGTSGLYKNLMFAFLVGAGLTVIAWAVKRRWPNKITKCMFRRLVLDRAILTCSGQYSGHYCWCSILW